MHTPPAGYLTAAQVAERINKSTQSAKYWLEKNSIHPFDWAGPGYIYKEEEINRILEPKPVLPD